MSGLSTVNIKKEASFDDLKKAVVPVLVTAAALKGVNSLADSISDKMNRRKFNGVISYAKQKHPELRKVPNDKMNNWMGAFYTLSPKMAVNKELGASMLATVHDYGGSIDLATAKLISETGEKRSKQKNGTEVLEFLNASSSLYGKHK